MKVASTCTNGMCIHELFQMGKRQKRRGYAPRISVTAAADDSSRIPTACQAYSNSIPYITLFNLHNTPTCEARTTIISFLQVSKSKHREVKQFTQDHAATKKRIQAQAVLSKAQPLNYKPVTSKWYTFAERTFCKYLTNVFYSHVYIFKTQHRSTLCPHSSNEWRYNQAPGTAYKQIGSRESFFNVSNTLWCPIKRREPENLRPSLQQKKKKNFFLQKKTKKKIGQRQPGWAADQSMSQMNERSLLVTAPQWCPKHRSANSTRSELTTAGLHKSPTT